MSELLEGLRWLPAPGADFRERCKDLGDDPSELGAELRQLATHALDLNQLHRLAKAIGRLPPHASLAPLRPVRFGTLSNATLSMVGPALVATAPRYGLSVELVDAGFAQVAQEALDPMSALNRARPDVVLLALDQRTLPLGADAGDVEQAVDLVESLWNGITAGCGATCIVQTVARIPNPLFGSLDRQLAHTARSRVDAFNRSLAQRLTNSDHFLLDIATLAEEVGLDRWHDPVQWHMAKLPFAPHLTPLHADHVLRLVAALLGKSRRALVLDLDNTLWGGVIGDDGLSGIRLGQGSGEGEAFLSIQRTALALRERGVVLTVCSKNEDAIARQVFREHPEMLLREDHISVFQANWTDKATNIRAIAETLSLGLDAFVFVDDNPFERNQVRQALPQVAVPELPVDPALVPRALLAAGYFESVSFSEEDQKRADYYHENAQRVAVQQQAGDLESYLESLGTQVTFAPFDRVGRSRIAQLINKSNQFNLTTRRRTEAQVDALAADPDYFTLAVRLSDKFGDAGMISVVICEVRAEQWEIDTWLMSCRVLGRRVEEAVLQEIVRRARAAGARRLQGCYLPTDRNMMVRDLLPRLGFAASDQQGEASSFVLELEGFEPVELPLTVEHRGFPEAR